MRCFLRAFLFAAAVAWLPLPQLALADANVLRLATTTSLENSGLLTYLLPAFESHCSCRVHVIPVGSGKALALGRRGDVDVLLVHAPAAEDAFVAAGYGMRRQPVAHNYFILLTPPADPAAVANSPNIFAALARIAAARAAFLSRGDESGTHQKEQRLWQALAKRDNSDNDNNLPPARSDWYKEAGSGMGQAIIMADQLGAYLLSDIATYLYLRDKVMLRPLSLPPDAALYNPYSVIRINPARHPHVNTALGEAFARWLQQPETRRRIGAYRLFGEAVFVPAAAAAEVD